MNEYDPDEFFEDLAASAEVMTIIISTVSPSVNKEATFDILLRAFQDGIDYKVAKQIGLMIRKTTRHGSSENKH